MIGSRYGGTGTSTFFYVNNRVNVNRCVLRFCRSICNRLRRPALICISTRFLELIRRVIFRMIPVITGLHLFFLTVVPYLSRCLHSGPACGCFPKICHFGRMFRKPARAAMGHIGLVHLCIFKRRLFFLTANRLCLVRICILPTACKIGCGNLSLRRYRLCQWDGVWHNVLLRCQGLGVAVLTGCKGHSRIVARQGLHLACLILGLPNSPLCLSQSLLFCIGNSCAGVHGTLVWESILCESCRCWRRISFTTGQCRTFLGIARRQMFLALNSGHRRLTGIGLYRLWAVIGMGYGRVLFGHWTGLPFLTARHLWLAVFSNRLALFNPIPRQAGILGPLTDPFMLATMQVFFH